MTPAYDPWDHVAVCRDESCDREEWHEAHAPIPLRGRTPKACPRCLKLLEGSPSGCGACGWTREGIIVAPLAVAPVLTAIAVLTSAWVACPACSGGAPGGDCTWCSSTGIIPRLRAVKVREAMSST